MIIDVEEEHMQPIATPNLPQKNVRAVLIDCRTDKNIIKSIEKHGIEAVLIPQCEDLPYPVSAHPDMLCHHLEGRKIIVYKKTIDLIGLKLEKLGFEVLQSDYILKPFYPYDCALNTARLSDKIIFNPKIIDDKIKLYIEEKGLRKIKINQGYAKCSICIVKDNSIITSDIGIAQAASRKGVDVLLIHKGYIHLSDYNYGFIGGTSGKIAENKLCFAGNIKLHPDYDIIKDFLHKNEVIPLSLSNDMLNDIGSILPLTEE
jgi:hypothetical protein